MLTAWASQQQGSGFPPDALESRIAWWYEPDAALIGPTNSGPGVVATLGTIGYIADKGPLAKHLTQATAGRRPKLNVDGGGKRYFYFDGTKDLYLDSASIDLTAHSKITVFFAGFVDATDAVNKIPFYFKPAGGAGAFAMLANATGATARIVGPSGQIDNLAAGIVSVATKLYMAEFDFASDRRFKRARIGRDGYQVPSGEATAPGVPVTAGALANAPLRFGDWGFSLAWEGGIYAMLAVVGDISDADMDNIAAYFATVAPTMPVNPSKKRLRFSHANEWQAEASNAVAQTANAYAFSTLYYDTTATSVTIDYYNQNIVGNYVSLGIYVDGSYHSEITPSGAGVGQAVVALPAGAKRVGIVTSAMTHTNGNYGVGTQVREVTFNAVATPYVYPSTGRVLVYGDSIATGGKAIPLVQQAWVMRLRGMTATDISLYGESARSFKHDSDNTTAAARSRLVDIVRGYNPAVLWFAMGVNDYGQAAWSAANFGTAYAAMLDALHAALPSLQIYAQSPLNPSHGSTPNALGSTLQDYSDAIEAACVGRAWATYVDGADIITDIVTDMDADGVHPNNAGNLTYANFVNAALS